MTSAANDWSSAIAAAAAQTTEANLVVGEPVGEVKRSLLGPMPWTVVSHGRDFLSSPSGAIVGPLASAGASFIANPANAALLSQAVSHDWQSSPDDPGLATQIKDNGIFSGPLADARADRMLRSFSVGGAGGAQVVIAGGEGGGGYVWDLLSSSDTGGYTFRLGKIGLGGGIAAGLLLGVWSQTPAQMQGDIVAFQVGVTLGAGALVSVVMNESDLSLKGFTVQVGVGAGLSGAACYGSMHVA